MSAFGGLILTNRGRNLQAKTQAGAELKYTRIALGDGNLGNTPIADLTTLKNQVMSLPIHKLKVLPEGRALIGTVLSNQELNTGFYFRELGIFALDPDLGEVLYCYGNSGSLAEYIPAGGGPDIIEKSIDIQTLIGNTKNVSAVIDNSLVYATESELRQVENSLRQSIDNISIPVTSVNEKTGDIILSAADVGAASQTAFNSHNNDNTRHITSSERTAWNNKVDKVAGKGLSTNDYTTIEKNKLAGLPTIAVNAINAGANNVDPNTTMEPYIMTNHANSPVASLYWHIRTYFYASQTSNKAQTAVSYSGNFPRMFIRHYYNSWSPWVELYSRENLTKTDIGLGSVQNYGIATQAEAEAGTSNIKYMTPLMVRQAIEKINIDNKVLGSYIGTNWTGTRSINLGFRPKSIIVLHNSRTVAELSWGKAFYCGFAIDGCNGPWGISINDTGFVVRHDTTGGIRFILNSVDEKYNYIAYK